MAEISNANKQHTQVKNDFRLIVKEKETKIENIDKVECEAWNGENQSSIKYAFDFVEFKDIIIDHEPIEKVYRYVDIISIVTTKKPAYEDTIFLFNGQYL